MAKFIPAILALLTCSCFYLLKGKATYKTIIWFFYALLFACSCYLFIDKLVFRYYHDTEWDFTSFYLWGKVAVTGHNFYLAENSQQVFNSLKLPDLNYSTFVADIVNVGFLYPPPAILYFAPLGFLSYKTALVLWTIFNLFFLAGSIRLTYLLFLKKEGVNGLMLTLILFFVFPPVRSTVFYSQTNFIVLFFLLLMKKYENSKYAGIFLAIAFFTKPYMAVFALFFIMKKNWKAIIYCAFTALVLLGITATLFGMQPIASYLFDNPAQRLPASVFYEDINQSLHAVLLRNNIISLNKPMTFISIAITMGILSVAYLFFIKQKKLYNYILPILLLVALILYPGTLDYYGVLLLFIAFQFFGDGQELVLNKYLTIPIIGLLFFLGTVSMFCAFWFLLVVMVLKTVIEPTLLDKLMPKFLSNELK